jgi:hypothetical protein
MHTRQQSPVSPMKRMAVAVVGIVLTAVVGSIAAAGEDLPAFRQGMWKFTRTVAGRTIESNKCTSPTDDMKRQNATLEKAGCKFSPLRKAGNTYTFEADCTLAGGVTSRTTSVLTVESDSAYRLDVTGTVAGEPTKETLVARRTGDCTK